jgi:hypothetical protein
MRTHLLHFCLMGLALAACPDGETTPNPSGSGELGVGTFTYRCRSEGDFTCPIGQTSAAFPTAFVLGGRFGLDYAWKSETDHINEPLPALQSAAPERLDLTDQTFTAVKSGFAAILAVTGNSEIVDLIHAHVRPIDDLRLVDAAFLPSTPAFLEIKVPLAGSAFVQLVPLDLNDTPLSGALEVAWSLDDEAIAAIAVGQGTGRVRVDGLVAGTATLTAVVGDVVTTVPLVVDPDLQPTTSLTDATTDDATTTLTTGTDGTTTATTGPETGTTAGTTTDPTAGTTGTTTDTTGGVL